MQKKSWEAKVIGLKIPKSIVSMEWKRVGSGNQFVAYDMFDNDWRIDGEIDGNNFRMWTSIYSDYREAIHLPVFIDVEGGVVKSVEIECFFSTGTCHGRPSYTCPQARERYQVGRLIKKLFRIR
jgi:hypothetical protein